MNGRITRLPDFWTSKGTVFSSKQNHGGLPQKNSVYVSEQTDKISKVVVFQGICTGNSHDASAAYGHGCLFVVLMKWHGCFFEAKQRTTYNGIVRFSPKPKVPKGTISGLLLVNRESLSNHNMDFEKQLMSGRFLKISRPPSTPKKMSAWTLIVSGP